MSFRLRLILAFAVLAIVQAAFFTLLSDQLIRDGIEGEADARLALTGSLFERELPERLWPPAEIRPRGWQQGMLDEVSDYAAFYGLDRATLLLKSGEIFDSQSGAGRGSAAERFLSDGMKEPQLKGRGHVSGPLFHSEDGWHKTLYFRLGLGDGWLRLEAGTPYLGQVAAIQKRLFRLALTLMLPSLLIGAIFAFAFAARAKELRRKLENARGSLNLGGSDEFAGIASSVDLLVSSLQAERDQNEKLLQGRISQARNLAFGVAHELRNPLAGMSLMLELFGRRAKEGAPASELEPIVGRIQSEAGRLEHTVARFLEFARTPVLTIERLELSGLVSEAAVGLQPQAQISGTALVQADRKACLLIAGILLSNACEAAGPQGTVKALLGPGSLQVWDSGEAVPDSAKVSLFTPFFTTKPKGMGLGLATASSLADAMGGRLSLLPDNKTFELRLPQP